MGQLTQKLKLNKRDIIMLLIDHLLGSVAKSTVLFVHRKFKS